MATVSRDGVFIRDELALFVMNMERTLVRHDGEHPHGEKDSLDMLYAHLLEEADELNDEFTAYKPDSPNPALMDAIAQEAIDLANMCMFVATKAEEISREEQRKRMATDHANTPGSGPSKST
ncbi:MAG TPA: hypothetical protein PL124_07115 [Candidatus Cloacimonadota bacterium]|nr:hypothetical protein [Candidatus Cloacimonadota bacterium]